MQLPISSTSYTPTVNQRSSVSGSGRQTNDSADRSKPEQAVLAARSDRTKGEAEDSSVPQASIDRVEKPGLAELSSQDSRTRRARDASSGNAALAEYQKIALQTEAESQAGQAMLFRIDLYV